MTDIPEVDLHAKNPREQEPTDFQHIVLLFERGDDEINHEELVKIVKDLTKKNTNAIMIHHLSGGDYKNGGMYPCIVNSCFNLNTDREFRPKKWYVENPSSNHTVEGLRETARLWHESVDVSERESMFGDLVGKIHTKPQNWDAAEKETLDRMNFVLLRYKKEIKVWMSPNRLARATRDLQIS